MRPETPDAQIRQTAFEHVNLLAAVRDGILDSADLAAGFEFQGVRIGEGGPELKFDAFNGNIRILSQESE